MADASLKITAIVETTVEQVKSQMNSRATRASNELINAKNLVLRGNRSGQRYTVPNTRRKYTASAPGEPPAVRTGQFRLKWDSKAYGESKGTGSFQTHSQIESNVRTDGGKYLLGEILEEGTPGGKIKPRPYQKKIIDKAKPKIVKIYKEKYL